MKTTQKQKSFLANSSKKYFKFGLATAILFTIAAFKLPIYAEAPNWDPPIAQEEFEIVYVNEIVPIKIRTEPEKKIEALVKVPVVAPVPIVSASPNLEPEPQKLEPTTAATTVIQKVIKEPVTLKKDPFKVVEQMPEFKGGLEKMYAYFKNNISYSNQMLDWGLEGRVYVRFVVDPDGSISNVEIAKGADPLLDKEALRVVKSMPKWNPGIQNGERVSVVLVLPINFQLH
jgi:periplasmic protein TonB